MGIVQETLSNLLKQRKKTLDELDKEIAKYKRDGDTFKVRRDALAADISELEQWIANGRVD